MADIVLVIFFSTVASIVFAISVARFMQKTEKMPLPPASGCQHTWEPWSDPQETPSKITQTWYGLEGKQETLTEKPVKFQERVCLDCNIYEKRWV